MATGATTTRAWQWQRPLFPAWSREFAAGFAGMPPKRRGKDLNPRAPRGAPALKARPSRKRSSALAALPPRRKLVEEKPKKCVAEEERSDLDELYLYADLALRHLDPHDLTHHPFVGIDVDQPAVDAH